MDKNHIKYQKMIEDTDTRLKNLMASWVLRYDYFGFLFSLIRRRAVVGLRNPMAVSTTKDGILELLYNPIIIGATDDENINEGLKHEGLHVLNKHLSRSMRLLADIPKKDREKHRKILNIAADCCVNFQGKIKNPLIIAGVPFKLHFPKDKGLKEDRAMEEYYYTLLERQRKEEQNGKGKGDRSEEKDDNQNDNQDNNPDGSDNSEDENKNQSQDGQGDGKDDNQPDEGSEGSGSETNDETNSERQQSGSGDGSPQGNELPQEGPCDSESDGSDFNNHQNWNSDEIVDPHSISRNIDNYIQRIIRDSYKNFRHTKARGKLPGYLQDLIEAALKPAPVPYYEIIRQFVRGSRLGKYKRSSTHINRKRMYVFTLSDKTLPVISPFPGRTRDLSFKIGIIIDTSGSQTPDDVIESLSGCADIIEKDRHCDVTILEVDTKIHKEYKLKRVHDIDFEVKGRGGTSLLPGVLRCKEMNVDVCVCFTDGYTEDFNEIDRNLFPKKMLWVITPKGQDTKVDRVGFVVHIPERNVE